MTRDVTAAERRVLAGKYSLVSSGVIALPEGEMGFAKSFLVRDPDGHAMQLIER